MRFKTKNRFRLQKSIGYFLFTVPAVGLYSFFFIIPVILGFYYSMTDWNGFSRRYNFVGMRNYIQLISDTRFRDSVLFTFSYTFLLVIFVITISLAIALFLNSKIRLAGLFKTIYFFPAVLSLITVGLIWNQIFYQVLPPIGKSLGIEWLSRNILGNQDTAMYGILITHIWQGVAIPIVIFLAGLQSVPRELYESAAIDGANEVQKFWYVTFPFIVPMLNVNLVLTVKAGLTVFDYIRAMTDGGPGYATESIGLLIYQHGFAEWKFGYGAAESILLLLLIAGISIIQLRVLNRKEVGQL